jgi:hypothetical protein
MSDTSGFSSHRRLLQRLGLADGLLADLGRRVALNLRLEVREYGP